MSPMRSNQNKRADFITIDKDNTSEFLLHETERVNSLLVENLSSKPLLILNGEIFEGAKQDRVANETVLIPNKSSVEIKVSFKIIQRHNSPKVFELLCI